MSPVFHQLLKMDVEGFEADAIQGSMQVDFSSMNLFLLFMLSSSFKIIGFPTF
jgi:hypothetical protein